MKKLTCLFLFGFWFCLIFQCALTEKGVQVDVNAPPFELLSQYHFFKGELSNLQPNVGVLPYDLNTPLFTDYAHKTRFVWMPTGTSASYVNEEVFEFPVGTVLIKNFYYLKNESLPTGKKRVMETRLLVRRHAAWEAHSYIWNKNQTEAKLDVVGDIIPISWTNAKGKKMQTDYIIPNKNQCKGCHSYKQKIMPIGPRSRNLNKDFAYEAGKQNQLEKWSAVGYLTGYNPMGNIPKAAQWNNPNDSLHHRAMAYLDVNCGHCHNPDGPGGTSGLNLVYNAPMGINLGINKSPVAAGRATGGLDYSIVKGKPDSSILVYRMEATEPGVAMPELGRTMVHEEGVALIRQWIEEMAE